VVAHQAADGLWHFKVETSGKYQIIAKQNDTWIASKSIELPAGDGSYADTRSAGIELLVDHRP
jgi:hypothetical protein